MSIEKVGDFINRHGFGVFIALVLLAELLGLNPYSPLRDLRKHTARDDYKETLFLRICLNTAKNPNEISECWASLFPEKEKR